ncbi:response regulator [Actinokineospora xionganensis]|uniref:Response regulator transcription factor n=1 Tax=Actinokineospora xionganensis TaxID=2684470 RepID=A0ABR7L434_9PSEU|nr:response regulator transcription factor [Actinokineospora xionganensis]MBC6447449.1 response regulator transcription factor [Actinokineospora xionganensis]
MIKAVVVDDEALIRSGFALILGAAPDIEVVATAVGGDAVAEVERHQPDVVLLDIRMPDVDGLTVLRQLRRLTSPPVVAMLTTFEADEYVTAALRSGAAGFILKDTDPAQLAQQVRTLAGGSVVLSPKVTRAVMGSGATPAEADAVLRVGKLSTRERTVLGHIAQGLSNGDIGLRMHLSTGTIKDNVSVILTKLGVDNRIQAALLAQRAEVRSAGETGTA